MPDWLPGVIIAAIAAIPACWGLIQGRHKTAAETEALLVSAYKSLVTNLQEQLTIATQGLRIEQEENRNLREVNMLLLEQKVHCESVITSLTARLAYYEGRPLYNANDLDDDND